MNFGNPNNHQFKLISINSILEDVFLTCSRNYPADESIVLKNELIDISSKLRTISQSQNANILSRYLSYDKAIKQYIFNLLSSRQERYNNDAIKNLIQDIYDDVYHLILKFKFKYGRPRPFQLAAEKKLKIFPFPSSSIDTPSFPSFTAAYAIVLCAALSNKFPDDHVFFSELRYDITSSRVYLGLNYQTDIDFSHEIASKILVNKIFNNKYNL